VGWVRCLPQFVDPGRPAATQVLTLGAVLALMGLAIGVVTALTAAALAARLRGRRTGGRPWGRWTSGAVYVALGAYAALGPAHRTAR
jgi:threonine/homoserine/homoserine lactone efflux protein